jgi:hypothetical protein
MTLDMLSYLLAVGLGLVCYVLVKHTADEYDRWYEQPQPKQPVARRVPEVVGVLLALVGTLLFLR